MSPAGDADLLVRARAALLDALDALAEHRDAVIVIGAQAIYLHTGGITLALAETTKDSDLTVDPRALADERSRGALRRQRRGHGWGSTTSWSPSMRQAGGG